MKMLGVHLFLVFWLFPTIAWSSTRIIQVPELCKEMVNFLAEDSSASLPAFEDAFNLMKKKNPRIGFIDPRDKSRVKDTFEFLFKNANHFDEAGDLVKDNKGKDLLSNKNGVAEACASLLKADVVARLIKSEPEVIHLGKMISSSETNLDPAFNSKAVNKCFTYYDAQSCVKALAMSHVIPQEFEEVVSMVSAQVKKPEAAANYDQNECACVLDQFEKAERNKSAAQDAIHDEDKKLIDLAYRSVGLRIVNDYAALVEDLQYYPAIEKKALDHFENKSADISEKLCTSPEGFKKAVQLECSKSGMNQGSMDRLSALMATMKPTSKKDSFDETLKSVNQEIFSFKFKNENGEFVDYTRADYDVIRAGIVGKENTLQYANKLVTAFLGNSTLTDAMNKLMEKGKDPSAALIEVMNSSEHIKDVTKLLKAQKKEHIDLKDQTFSALYELKTQDDIKSRESFNSSLVTLFKDAVVLNPSFKRIMSDRNLFSKVSKKFDPHYGKNWKNGLIGVMKNRPDVLMGHYSEKCDLIHKQVAEVVCTSPEKVLDKINPESLGKMSKVDRAYLKEKNVDQEIVDAAICSKYNKFQERDKKSAFFDNSIFNTNKYLISDYADRQYAKDSAYKNGFSKSINLFKPGTSDTLRNAVAFASSSNNTMKEFESKTFADQIHGNSYKTAISHKLTDHPQTTASAAPVQKSDIIFESSVSKEMTSPSNFDTPRVSHNTIPSVSSSVSQSVNEPVKSADQEFFDNREKLSKEVSKFSSKESFKDHINSLSEKDAEEMLRLRDQAQKDGETIAQLRLEQERTKTENLKREYEQLKAKFDSLEKGYSISNVPSKNHNVTSGGSSTSYESIHPQFENAGLRAPASVSGTTTGGRSSGGFSSSSSPLASASVSDMGSGSAQAAGSNASVNVSASVAIINSGNSSDGVRGLALTVTQSVSGDGKIIVAEDPNRVLINYLTKNEPSIKQLEDLKVAGLVLTEEDVLNDGQKVQVKKTIKFKDLSAEAKSFVEKKLAQVQMLEAKRNYSRQLLMMNLLGTVGKDSRLNVKKTGSLNF